MGIWSLLSTMFGVIGAAGLAAFLFLCFFIETDFVQRKKLRKKVAVVAAVSFGIAGLFITTGLIFASLNGFTPTVPMVKLH